MVDPAPDASPDRQATTPGSDSLDALASVATAGVVLFLAIVVLLHMLQPGLDPASRFVSEYASGPAGWLMRVAFFALAAALVTFAVAFGRQLRPPLRSRAAGILFSVAALGILLSGVFDSDLQTDAGTTTQGVIHDLAGFVAFLTLLPAMVAVAGRVRKNRPGHAGGVWLTVHAWAVIVLFLAMLFLFEPPGLVGLGQRIFLAAMLAWLLIVARGVRSGTVR